MEIKITGTTTYNGHTFPKIECANISDVFKDSCDLFYKEEDEKHIDN